MGKQRLEAFSDGVIAIIITIMVLELKAPAGTAITDLTPLLPTFLSYLLSFVYVGIYWNNHHHMLRAARSVSGPVMWANMLLLFWLSMVPFATSWMGEHPYEQAPVGLYGFVLLMNSVSYWILASLLIRHEGPQSDLAKAFGHDVKGKVSTALYVVAMIAATLNVPLLSKALYVLVAMIWFIPDRRVEKVLVEDRSLED